MACRRSRSLCQTTKSRPLSSTFARHGAIAEFLSAPATRIACAPLRSIEAPMINSPLTPSRADEVRDADIEAIVESGPRGAIALAGSDAVCGVGVWVGVCLY